MSASILSLDAELVPGISAAGFSIGECFFEVGKKIGEVTWYDPATHVRDVIAESDGWVGVVREVGFGGDFIWSYHYMDDLVVLYFEEKKILYRISVGKGYEGGFYGVKPGDDIRAIEDFFDLVFNSADDEFLLENDCVVQKGISFITDFRASLERAPYQIIQHISVHDWSLR